MTKIEKVLYMKRVGTPDSMIQEALGVSAGFIRSVTAPIQDESKVRANVTKAFQEFAGRCRDLQKSLGKALSVSDFVPKWTRELVSKGFSEERILSCFYPESHDQVRSIVRQLRGYQRQG